jgi:hypothetical protein
VSSNKKEKVVLTLAKSTSHGRVIKLRKIFK